MCDVPNAKRYTIPLSTVSFFSLNVNFYYFPSKKKYKREKNVKNMLL